MKRLVSLHILATILATLIAGAGVAQAGHPGFTCSKAMAALFKKHAATLVSCTTKAVKNPAFDVNECESAATDKMIAKYSAIVSKILNAGLGSCIDISRLEFQQGAEEYAADLIDELNIASQATLKCQSAKFKIAHKFFAQLMTCSAKNAGPTEFDLADCVLAARSRMLAGVVKAQAKGGCGTFGDGDGLADYVYGFAQDLVDVLDFLDL